MTKVKICGITNKTDAYAAIDFGADALGFVFYNKSPRSITPEDAKTIISSLPPFITSVGVFVNEDAQTIESLVNVTGINVIQLHGSEPPERCIACRPVIKAFQVKDDTALDGIKLYAKASALLLDTYSADVYGGTGTTFNWELAVQAGTFGNIVLAGGLTPDNIESAIRQVRPYGVDVSSGVESRRKGIKDIKKLRDFIGKAKDSVLYE
ncbi:MAG: phosphoribosylanthranilate isomerase [Nitrospira sp.]|nr:phosphoribosylanthranilate isomerase [bacterium]MBL7050215.1 phosphoribosylanthranilate isomerase [Nitrospira sp.]